MLSSFTVDTGPYKRQKFGYRKRTSTSKLVVQLPLVEEHLSLIVRTTFIKIKFTEANFTIKIEYCLVLFITKVMSAKTLSAQIYDSYIK